MGREVPEPAPEDNARRDWAREKRDVRLAEARERIARKISELDPEDEVGRGRLQRALLRFDNEISRISKPERGNKE